MNFQENGTLLNTSTHSQVAAPPKAGSAGQRTWIVLLCAIVATVILSGCATTGITSGADSLQFNPLTGYPAVGRFDETGW